MSGRDDHGPGPLPIIGALLALGAVGSSRGQLMLRRVKRLAGRTAVASLLLSPLTLLLDRPDSIIWFGIAIMLAISGCVIWCYAAFARWLTRDEEIER